MIEFEARPVDAFTDADFEAAEAARVKAAVDRTVSNGDILRALARVQETIDGYGVAIAQVVAVAEEVKDKVDPVVQGLMSNPMFKMFLGKAGR